jgi:hypothetical protein
MKGASTFYGSGAATGINITLKKQIKKAIAGNVYMNMGLKCG